MNEGEPAGHSGSAGLADDGAARDDRSGEQSHTLSLPSRLTDATRHPSPEKVMPVTSLLWPFKTATRLSFSLMSTCPPCSLSSVLDRSPTRSDMGVPDDASGGRLTTSSPSVSGSCADCTCAGDAAPSNTTSPVFMPIATSVSDTASDRMTGCIAPSLFPAALGGCSASAGMRKSSYSAGLRADIMRTSPCLLHAMTILPLLATRWKRPGIVMTAVDLRRSTMTIPDVSPTVARRVGASDSDKGQASMTGPSCRVQGGFRSAPDSRDHTASCPFIPVADIHLFDDAGVIVRVCLSRYTRDVSRKGRWVTSTERRERSCAA
mmetsp:Transcript_10521/g.25517  ORF Transcript_10521/g.25517 Transcript_10521/m.25517 type:complete len:320 (-) Transcript_10521:301-1260(-)